MALKLTHLVLVMGNLPMKEWKQDNGYKALK
jgi:hypothetical protein